MEKSMKEFYTAKSKKGYAHKFFYDRFTDHLNMARKIYVENLNEKPTEEILKKYFKTFFKKEPFEILKCQEKYEVLEKIK